MPVQTAESALDRSERFARSCLELVADARSTALARPCVGVWNVEAIGPRLVEELMSRWRGGRAAGTPSAVRWDQHLVRNGRDADLGRGDFRSRRYPEGR